VRSVTHEIEAEKVQANGLRRYITARASGRRHAEYTKLEIIDDLAVWVGATEVEARASGMKYRHLRQTDRWCDWLGHDTSIQDDHALAAYLELAVSDEQSEHDWNRLLKEVTRNRVPVLRSWRQKGLDILTRQSQRQTSPASMGAYAKALVSEKYMKRGTGIRPLKAVKSTK
jgi:hypothetical protein